MPKISHQTKLVRAGQVTGVLARIAEGVPEKVACDEMGISHATYRRWLASNSDAIKEVARVVTAMQVLRLNTIVSNQLAVLDKLINDALSEETKPAERLSIAKYMGEELERLRRELEVVDEETDPAAEYLSGPTLSVQPSRIPGSQTTVLVPRKDGSIEITQLPTILPGESQDVGE